MDVPRLHAARNRLIKRIVIGTVALGAIVAVTLVLMRLKPAAPPVDKGAVWMDTVSFSLRSCPCTKGVAIASAAQAAYNFSPELNVTACGV